MGRCHWFFIAFLNERLTVREEESAGFCYLAGLGIFAGVMIVTAGLFALFNSRRVFALDNFTKRVAVGHMVTSILSAVFCMAIFMLRVMFLTVLPGVHPDHESWKATEILPMISTGLYSLSFVALGVSVGFSFAVLKAMKEHSRCDYSNVLTVQISAPEEPSAIPEITSKSSQTPFLANMEATVDGYYQKLQNEDDE